MKNRGRIKRASQSVELDGVPAYELRAIEEWYEQEAPAGLRDQVEPWTFDARELPTTWGESTRKLQHAHTTGQRAPRGPASSDGKDVETFSRTARPDTPVDRIEELPGRDGRKHRTAVALTQGDLDAQQQSCDQGFVTRRLKVGQEGGRSSGRVLRFERQPDWVDPEQDAGERASVRQELVAPDAAPANDDSEPMVYREHVPELHCEHCERSVRTALRKGLCMACYQYHRRNRQLPDKDTVLRARRWVRLAPVADRKGPSQR